MGSNQSVMVFVEQDSGKVAEVSLELICKGRDLANQLGVGLGAILLGSGVGGLADELFAYGCDEVHLADHAELATYRTRPYARVACDIIRKTNPQIVLYGASHMGRDLAPRVASALRVGLTADCTDLQIGSHRDIGKGIDYEKLLYQIRPAFGGNIIATIVNPETRPQMATVREGVMKMGAPQPGRKGMLVRFGGELDESLLCVDVLEEYRAERKVNLKKANIIVSGGAGVGSKEGFDLIRRLAEVLGGQVGASRAAVDAGYIEKAHQVGQTGTTVRPKLYIACGISGAVQHRAGMEESAKIIAINTDREAPIFSVAHYGVVGDLNKVIPMMVKALKERR